MNSIDHARAIERVEKMKCSFFSPALWASLDNGLPRALSSSAVPALRNGLPAALSPTPVPPLRGGIPGLLTLGLVPEPN
jgi:hypothetical protein